MKIANSVNERAESVKGHEVGGLVVFEIENNDLFSWENKGTIKRLNLTFYNNLLNNSTQHNFLFFLPFFLLLVAGP